MAVSPADPDRFAGLSLCLTPPVGSRLGASDLARWPGRNPRAYLTRGR